MGGEGPGSPWSQTAAGRRPRPPIRRARCGWNWRTASGGRWEFATDEDGFVTGFSVTWSPRENPYGETLDLWWPTTEFLPNLFLAISPVAEDWSFPWERTFSDKRADARSPDPGAGPGGLLPDGQPPVPAAGGAGGPHRDGGGAPQRRLFIHHPDGAPPSGGPWKRNSGRPVYRLLFQLTISPKTQYNRGGSFGRNVPPRVL